MVQLASPWTYRTMVLVTPLLAGTTLAANVLKTVGFSDCGGSSDITVTKAEISFDNDNKILNFDVAGSSAREQFVKANVEVTAYGNLIFSQAFNPCDDETFVDQLCPVPSGPFASNGSMEISEFSDLIPDIAFNVPDIAASARLELLPADDTNDNDRIACIQSQVSNGKTINVPAVPYIAVGIAGGALAVSGLSAVSSAFAGGAAAAGGGSGGGVGTMSPSFTEVFVWLQGMAMNGMLSVNYPPVYRTFTTNFAFTTGLISWPALQMAIDDMRAKTGGNLTGNSYEALKNATLQFPDGSTVQPSPGIFSKRGLATIMARQHDSAANDTGADPFGSGPVFTVSGIKAYAEQLAVPGSNTFMTVLLVISIVIGSIVVGMMLVKVVLEGWAIFGNFPEKLAGFRKHYWGSIARTVTSLILLLYGIWVLYCVFQFTNGDSAVAKALAGATLGIFTAVLAFFSWRIWSTARALRKMEGDTSGLYEDKNIWTKYSIFYDAYKKSYWWLFVPTIVYMFVKGCIIAGGDGHGLAQTAAQLIVEAIMLALLVWGRPYERRSGNIINIVIQTVRVLSVVCILVFVEEFGIEQSTQTVTGIALMATQSALTGILAILILWNGINMCCKDNPHRKRRKERERRMRDMDTLTPLDARNSLLTRPDTANGSIFSVSSIAKPALDEKVYGRSPSTDRYAVFTVEEEARPQVHPVATPSVMSYRDLTPAMAQQPHVTPGFSGMQQQPTLPVVNGAASTAGPTYAGGYGHGAPYRYAEPGYRDY